MSTIASTIMDDSIKQKIMSFFNQSGNKTWVKEQNNKISKIELKENNLQKYEKTEFTLKL